jgi:hypothetical protein
MKWRSLVSYAAFSLSLLLVGAALRGLGHVRQQAVNAHRQLLAMRYTGLPSQYDALAQSAASRSRLPWSGAVQTAVAEQRAELRYWQRDYQALVSPRDASGTVVEQNPEILLLAANAAYRRARLEPTDRDTAERLQAIVGQYADVIKRDPDLLDAVYNYEFTARIRDLLIHQRGAPAKPQSVLPKPSPQTIHGRTGAAPVQTDMGRFKLLIPQRPDERKTTLQSGSGSTKARKG